MSQSIRDK